MSLEAIERARTNREAALLATADAEQARRITELWNQPVLADSEIPEAAKIPPSLWAECKAEGDSPPLFTIGRRLFVLTADLLAWLEQKARAGRPGSKRLRRAAAEAAAREHHDDVVRHEQHHGGDKPPGRRRRLRRALIGEAP